MRLIVMLVSFVLTTQLWAGELPQPSGTVLLTLSGNIENTNADGKAVFDTASLEKLGMVSSRPPPHGIMDALLLRVFHYKSSWITSARAARL